MLYEIEVYERDSKLGEHFIRGIEDWAPPRPQLILTRPSIVHNERCAGCGAISMNRRNWQICEYFGKQFCPACMHDVRHYLPEKIISNWDFGHKYQLSRRAVSVLDKNLNQPFIDLDMVNPELEKTVSEIRLVKELRQRLRILKRLIGSCKNASNEQYDCLVVI
ncbi:hypothetical protein ACOME3_010537 [Neoechinorhynchus agilis]